MSNSPDYALPRPDLVGRERELTLEREMRASPSAVYRAWTEGFDTWFAQPGVIRMRPEVGEPFFFETEYKGARHSHYGRFLTLEQDRFVELTWMTGRGGTAGAETIVSVELSPNGRGTHLRLRHGGFYDEASLEQHRDAWVHVLAAQDDLISKVS